MQRYIAGTFWITLYLVVVLTPMFLMLVRPTPAGRDFWIEFSVALGFVGLTQMAVQFVLIARYRNVTAPYGIDIILQYHRQIALMALALILAHPAILVIENPARLGMLNPFGGNWASRAGNLAVYALVLLVLFSVFRQRINLDYEVWRVTHTLLGITALAFAHLHVSLAGVYLNTFWKQGLWKVFGVLMLSSLVYLRIIKPALQKRERYQVAELRRERGQTWSLALEPVGHAGTGFMPGQFAWIKLGDTPYTIEEHPFSFSSSAEKGDRIEFGIKELGDFTSELKQVPAGTTAYLDGPHGAFSIDRVPAAGYVLIGGGIGITPMMSILRTMADRDDVRPVLLLYGEKVWEGVAYREDLEALKAKLNLSVVYVLEDPPEDWQGETGFITEELLKRRLPKERIKREFFVCGPPIMMEVVQEALIARGVALESIHMEHFNLV